MISSVDDTMFQFEIIIPNSDAVQENPLFMGVLRPSLGVLFIRSISFLTTIEKLADEPVGKHEPSNTCCRHPDWKHNREWQGYDEP